MSNLSSFPFADVDPDTEWGGRFIASLGVVPDEVTLERVHMHLDAGPQHQQPYGILHGGVYCALVETVASFGAGFALAESGHLVEGTKVVGVSNTTDFLRAHSEGRLDAVGTPIHVGRTYQIWQVEITRAADQKPVARGQVRFQHVPGEQPLV